MLGRGMCSLSALLAVRIVIIHNTKLSYGVSMVHGVSRRRKKQQQST